MARETGEWGCGLGCDQERTQVQREGTRRGQWEKGLGSQEARPGQENRLFHTGGSCSQGPSTTSLLSPSPETGPQILTVGASEEEAESSRASRGNSDAGDPQRQDKAGVWGQKMLSPM